MGDEFGVGDGNKKNGEENKFGHKIYI